ncbi:hypothetical protein B0O80DRAFT_465386 [Mortierella sp. GBAus27b]|nr:hypothetical protein B0O80DRAFT_465386 [Mortierella sp. GBAus27b]
MDTKQPWSRMNQIHHTLVLDKNSLWLSSRTRCVDDVRKVTRCQSCDLWVLSVNSELACGVMLSIQHSIRVDNCHHCQGFISECCSSRFICNDDAW